MDRAVIVAVDYNKHDVISSVNELKNIATALNIDVVNTFIQRLPKPDLKTYVGSGKAIEIKHIIDNIEADIAIFDDELSPTQIRNLEKILDVQIIDRSFLILSIFAERAQTKSAKLEVSLAQQKYLMPRLVGMGLSLSRQGGGTYNAKGPGETKLELDRRVIQETINKTEAQIKKLNRQKKTAMKLRIENRVPIVSLVGYTNAGKSATLNALIEHLELDSNLVFEKDILFATLDTTARRITKKGFPDFILTDTIGFLSRLPHEFINSFKSTLSEIENSNLILHIIDGTSPMKDLHKNTTINVLNDLNANHIETLEVYTRLDLASNKDNLDGFWISNKTKENINLLINIIYKVLFGDLIFVELKIPYDKQNIVSELNDVTRVLNVSYEENYILMAIKMFDKQLPFYKDYLYSFNNSSK